MSFHYHESYRHRPCMVGTSMILPLRFVLPNEDKSLSRVPVEDGSRSPCKILTSSLCSAPKQVSQFELSMRHALATTGHHFPRQTAIWLQACRRFSLLAGTFQEKRPA